MRKSSMCLRVAKVVGRFSSRPATVCPVREPTSSLYREIYAWDSDKMRPESGLNLYT